MAKTVEQILDDHMYYLGIGDVEKTLEDYAPDAFMINQNKVIRGTQELRAHFANSVKNVLTPGTKSETLIKQCVDNVGYVVWKAETDKLIFSYASDTFVIENGKITAQTFAAVVQKK